MVPSKTIPIAGRTASPALTVSGKEKEKEKENGVGRQGGNA
jgi:hypothetical protein